MDHKDEMILIQVRLLRLAAKTWHKEMPEVAKLFRQFKVYDFMQDMYEEFHVQGDNTTFDEFKDTTFSWKLVYKDLHGIGDTLDITTTIMAHEDDTSTKCFNHITGSRHCNFNFQPMRMNRRYLDRRFWRLKEPMIK